MSGAGPASPGRGPAAAPPHGDRSREAPAAGSPIQAIIKDVGEIYSRLLDHRPVIQGEIRYFVKEFEASFYDLEQQTDLLQFVVSVQAANDMIHKLQEKECEVRKLQADKVMAREEKCIAHWEEFMKEQQNKRAEVDEEHRKAMERLKEQYSEMEKELAKYVSF
ncbi:Biogenesis of lysosome-related organelles complex 1 subunit 5 [Pitangus sulphuratus]|nr:Biogenesis of lysosome-related organelles complex 1 subunit 5 [Pitangus sulphuratus]